MKDIIIIITIIVVIFGGDALVNSYLKKTSSKLTKQLEQVKDKINKNEDNETIKEDISKVFNEWQNIEKTWAIIVLHSELDAIETSLIRTKVNIKEKEWSIGLENLETSIFFIEHISQKEKFCLKNIF